MDCSNDSRLVDTQLAQLREYAEKLRLEDYWLLSERLISTLKGTDLGEVHLSRAQIRLMMSDGEFIEDLKATDALLQGSSRFPSFFVNFEPHASNTFFLFPSSADSFARFAAALPESHGLFRKYCGDSACGMAKLIEGEILYFSGRFEDTVALVEPVYRKFEREGNCVMAIFASYTLIRACLATGRDTYRTTAQVIEWTRKYPETCCPLMYETIRSWANATTGWSGDTLRYHKTPSGLVLPALEDRADAIEHGICELPPTEVPFAELLRFRGIAFHTMRGFYIDIFNMMVQFKFQSKKAAEASFREIYAIARDMKLVTPLVEYGRQIVPLLKYVLETDHEEKYDVSLIDSLIFLAERYEKQLELFRRD